MPKKPMDINSSIQKMVDAYGKPTKVRMPNAKTGKNTKEVGSHRPKRGKY